MALIRFVALGALILLSGCGANGLCGPVPQSPRPNVPECPAESCHSSQMRCEQPECQKVCSAAACWQCDGTRWSLLVVDCAPSCR